MDQWVQIGLVAFLIGVGSVREVKRLFEDYKENIRAMKRYEEHNIREQMVKVRVSKFEDQKVQGGTITKEDSVMARRIDIANSNSNAIKQIKSDLEPFVMAWGKLNREHRTVLRSRYMKCRTINEVAEELDLSLSTAKTKLSNAEKRFYKLYDHYSKEV